MRERTRRRVERIREQVHVIHLLEDYGYDVRSDFSDAEQQFSCDLHGDGNDNTPSARVYPDGSWYCFGCQEQRDAIATVMAKEGCSFLEAVSRIETRFNLPPLPFDPDEVEQDTLTFPSTLRTYEHELKRVRAYLDTITREGLLPHHPVLSLWEAYDQVAWQVQKENWSEQRGQHVLLKILSRSKELTLE